MFLKEIIYFYLLTIVGNISVTPYGKTRIMGIINVSPESFYKDSIKRQEDEIQDMIIRMQDHGVDIVDVGGMSTAPYLKTLIPKELESKRLHNAISAIRQISNIPISVDTVRSDVIRSLLKLEVNAINDVTGLKYDKNMPNLAYEHDLPVIIGAYLSEGENLYGDGDIHDTSFLLSESIRIAKKSKIDNDKLLFEIYTTFVRFGAISYILLNRISGYCIPATTPDSNIEQNQDHKKVLEELHAVTGANSLSPLPCYCDIQFSPGEFLTVINNPNHPFSLKLKSIISEMTNDS